VKNAHDYRYEIEDNNEFDYCVGLINHAYNKEVGIPM
jgi:predicted transport protein